MCCVVCTCIYIDSGHTENKQTDRQTDGRTTDGRTDDRQTDGRTDIQTDRQTDRWKPLGERDYFAKLLVDTNADADRCWWMLMLMGTDGRWGWWTLMMTDADANRRWGTLMLTDAGGRWCGQWQTLMMSYDADGRWCWWSPQPKFFDGGSVFPKQLTILETVKNVNFLWRHVTKKRDFVRRRGFGISEAAFDREHFATN